MQGQSTDNKTIDISPGKVLGIYHFNVNAKDLEESEAFYKLLGFRTVSRFDEECEGLNRGLGFEDYPRLIRTRAIFMKLGGQKGLPETVIDLVQWDDPISHGEAPDITHIGMVRFALRVDDIDAIVPKLKEQGIGFLSEPQVISTLERKPRFVCLKDPNGILIELVEV